MLSSASRIARSFSSNLSGFCPVLRREISCSSTSLLTRRATLRFGFLGFVCFLGAFVWAFVWGVGGGGGGWWCDLGAWCVLDVHVYV